MPELPGLCQLWAPQFRVNFLMLSFPFLCLNGLFTCLFQRLIVKFFNLFRPVNFTKVAEVMSGKTVSDISKPVMTIVETGAGYRITQVRDFEYSDHFEGYHDDKPKIARELIVEVILPGVTDPGVIDAEVMPREVRIKAPGSFRAKVVKHDFAIPLPFEVLTNVEYSASFSEQVLTLRLKVRPQAVERKPFRLAEPEPVDSSDDEVPAPEPAKEEPKREKNPAQGPVDVKEARFSLTTEEKVVTIVLYVARAVEDTLRIDGNHIEVATKDGTIYQCDVNPPFPLKSKPVMKTNPVSIYLVFVEGDDEPEPEAPVDEEPVEGQTMELRNPLIFELEPYI